ncbi:heparinase II/III family protein [Nonomuraea sp. NPDC049152]|uniref:heparinase II/III domain-containing protein n=1 Tax=Nonomuraea sp. NPDC049152 TaxID=3154350 RepID=UPI0033ECD167
MRRLALPLALLLALGGMIHPASAAVKRTPECQGDWLPATPTAAEVMKGEISFLDLPPVKIGQDVNWRTNPYNNRSWGMVFHSLRWMGRLVAEYEGNGEERYLARATEIAKDWVKDNPRHGAASPYAWAEHPIALRAPALVCLSKHVNAPWLKESLAQHAKVLGDDRLYEWGHNHGIDQDIALLGIGCRLGDKRWQDHAIKRLTKTVRLDIDSQGALMEQAPRYAIYVHDRLKVAMDNLKDCGRKVPGEISKRWGRLGGFIMHSTRPNGYMVPIGDGGADHEPTGFANPSEKTKVFKAGYVYGRTAWNKPESAFYSIRFGPGVKFHGHEDHLGVTYYAQGRDVLVDTGFHSYESTPYRYWTMSPEAHNVPTVVGARFRPRTATKLARTSYDKDRQRYQLTDKAYGVSRTRSVLVNHDQDVMAVLDTAGGGKKVSDIWRFDSALKVVSNAGGKVVLGDGKFRVSLVQLAGCAPVGGQKVERGGKLGWVSPTYMAKNPATVVVSPAARSILTVIVPGTDQPKVSCAGGKVTVQAADGPVTFKASIF